MGMSKKAKVMKVRDDEQHNKAVYLHVVQAKANGGHTHLRPNIV